MVGEDVVGVWGGRVVRVFDDQVGIYGVSVGVGDDFFEGCGYEDVDIEFEQFDIVDACFVLVFGYAV